MNKTLLTLGLIVVIATLSILYVVLNIMAPYINIWIVIILAAFVLIFGFMLGIKFMSEMGT